MKKIVNQLLILVIIVLLPISGIGQMRDPGNPGGDPTGGDEPIGGGAPVGNGLFVLLIAGAAYGARKVYEMRKEELEA